MEADVLRIAQLFAVIGTFTAGMIGLAWVTKVAFRERKQQKPEAVVPGVDEARFARLENAIETIAVEVERIAEAQRFAMKLQAGRGEPALPAPSGRAAERSRERVTTPLP